MCGTDSSLNNMVVTPLKPALLYLSSMRFANSSLNNPICTKPLWLQNFLLAPCVTQTPPVMAWLGIRQSCKISSLRLGDTNTTAL
jgi:hypothetical protein